MDKTAEQVQRELAAPFPDRAIEWVTVATKQDKGKGLMVPVVGGRAVQDRLDQVLGMTNWRTEIVPVREHALICKLSVRIDGEWITKEDGADEVGNESMKGGCTAAFKRAALQWGIGRYLARVPKRWIPGEVRGKSFYPSTRPVLPRWALPDGQSAGPDSTEDPRVDSAVFPSTAEAPPGPGSFPGIGTLRREILHAQVRDGLTTIEDDKPANPKACSAALGRLLTGSFDGKRLEELDEDEQLELLNACRSKRIQWGNGVISPF